MLVVFTLTVVVPCHCFWTCSELLAPSLPPCSALNCIVSSSLLFPSIAPADATKPVERGHGHHRRSAASAGPAGTSWKTHITNPQSSELIHILYIHIVCLSVIFTLKHTFRYCPMQRQFLCLQFIQTHMHNKNSHSALTETFSQKTNRRERPHLHCFCTHFVNLAVLFFKWAVVFLNYLWRKLS